tara:strand:+ start:86 stop:952 length:867 start_codon:yes stop_codon:yes gene_type:complete
MENKMTIVRKAIAKDFEKIYPLLKRFENPRLKKKDWKQLFIDHWKSNEGYFGYVLEDDKIIVGFLGLMFSRRVFSGKEIKFCNITSWVVDENFRSQSLLLFLPVRNLKGYTLTIHTPSKETYAVAQKFGFQDLGSHLLIIPPLPSVSNFFTFFEVEINGNNLSEILTGENLKAYKAHLPFKCFHIHVKTSMGECYVIGSRVNRKKLAFFQVHHLSDSRVFAKFSGRITLAICFKIIAIGVVLDERFLQENKVMLSAVFPLPYPRVYKSDFLGKNEIDSLYSELPVLNI